MKCCGAFICSFGNGLFRIQNKSGKRVIQFEDSDRFGPSEINLRTGDLSPISDSHKWFWDWYPTWIEAGRPCEGQTTSPVGDVLFAKLEW